MLGSLFKPYQPLLQNSIERRDIRVPGDLLQKTEPLEIYLNLAGNPSESRWNPDRFPEVQTGFQTTPVHQSKPLQCTSSGELAPVSVAESVVIRRDPVAFLVYSSETALPL